MECLPTAINNGHMAKNNKTKVKLGGKIQKIRKALGYSQEELADLARISRTHMGHIEQGRKSPSLEVLEKIAKTLRVKVKDLIPY